MTSCLVHFRCYDAGLSGILSCIKSLVAWRDKLPDTDFRTRGGYNARSEIGTRRRRSRLLKLILGPGQAATDFVHERGCKIAEIMTHDPVTISEDTSFEAIVTLMEKNKLKRLPVMRGEKLVGIVSRANLLQAVASLAREISDPTADDDHTRNLIINALGRNDWCPHGLSVVVRDGIVNPGGIITDERSRPAAIVCAENTSG